MVNTIKIFARNVWFVSYGKLKRRATLDEKALKCGARAGVTGRPPTSNAAIYHGDASVAIG